MIDKYDNSIIEKECMEKWEQEETYKYDPALPRDKVFAVDSPPPTVSGELHIGSVYGYAQADTMARFHRMQGKNLFFPMGWDDNGLPTERRVQNYFNIKCDPSLSFDPNFKPEHKEKFETPQKPISRKNFIQACLTMIEQDEKIFENIFRRMGLSYDWDLMYSTIDSDSIRIAQESFIKLFKSGHVKSIDAPTMWDTDFQTAVALAEIEDREVPGFFHDIKFKSEAGDFIVATTRPEFLPACIAIVCHPDDKRYKHLIGKTATVPLFGVEIPIYGDPHADMEKGTGIMMVCTFGDAEDVKFWREYNLPLKQIIGRDGKIIDSEFITRKELVGLKILDARKKIIEWLKESGELVGEPKPIKHSVKFYEKGDTPIEFVSSRQWFIITLDKKDKLIAAANKVRWTPDHMRLRFINWTENLNQNWAISRQRFFGVPFPVWYKLDANGEPIFEDPILATNLPCDPMSDTPEGFKESERGKSNGFVGDSDIMDTWMTSTLTPKIALAKLPKSKLSVPFDARWSGPEIIRTWDFYTILITMLNDNGKLPWHELWINGWVLDPDRKKMSKSKGNVVVPSDLVEKYGSDAIRLWAASTKWGTDTTTDEKIMEQKKKLVVKFFNAAKFVLSIIKDKNEQKISNLLDLGFIKNLSNVCEAAKKSFLENDHTNALIATEQAFWDFCDNYLEIAKMRAYAGESSAVATLRLALETFCGLFAPFMPFITEYVWKDLNKDSIHSQLFPTEWPDYKDGFSGNAENYTAVCKLVSVVRGKKSEASKSMKAPIKSLTIADSEFLRASLDDIKNVLSAKEIILSGNEPVSKLVFVDTGI